MARATQVARHRCKWCETERDGRGFKRHEESCKRQYLIEHPMDIDEGPQNQDRSSLVPNPPQGTNDTSPVSEFYIKIVPHSHKEGATTSYISLDGGTVPGATPEDTATPNKFAARPTAKPWAPFRTRADFGYAESVVLPNMPRKWVDAQLEGIGGDWSNARSNITFCNYDHMEKTLAAARKYAIVQFQTGEVEADFQGKTYKYEFQYRDPWKWVVDLLSDPTLADDIHWFPEQNFLVENGVETRLYDEPYTANKWARIQDTLPQVPRMPHCYVPLALWLNKGMVTKRVRKHPVVLRPLFLDSNIRNASGNGGGVLIAYMVIPIDPSDSSDRNAAETIDWARFRREIVHKVFKIIFATLRKPAKHGEALTCGDEFQRVCYPGIPITSIDGEEACSVSACRAALANFPCPRCLVHHNDLGKICDCFTLRTTETMKQIYEDAMAAPTKTESEHILQSVGLHATENFFWSLPNSDPYSANAYDLLHSDEGGKWGKHIWPLLLDVLKAAGYKGRLTMKWAGIPRHIKSTRSLASVSPQLSDTPKCILPCIVQLLPSKSCLVHCIRYYQLCRFTIGLKCGSDTCNLSLNDYKGKYQKYCERVKNEYDKDFNFYKQHAMAHVVEDITEKGAPPGYSTRPGEGFHQEVKEAFDQTNFRNTDPQLARIDENKEAFARIRMAVEEYDALRSTEAVGEDFEVFKRDGSDLHWSLGSPLKWTTAEILQHDLKDRNFAANLRAFRNEFVVDQALHPDQVINVCSNYYHFSVAIMSGWQIQRHHCIRLRYQSSEDWTEQRDILRCNPMFFGSARYDHVLVNHNPADLTVARLVELMRCKLSDDSIHDIAIVHMLKPSKWVPKTKWAGVRVYDESKSLNFVMVKYLIRGAHMIPVFDANKPSSTFLNDLIDGDMFLRAGN
ncbi:hypothetical protein GGX14DRAFT_659051 [Mycena pura]|uniref:Uncharacterized protein n=1 Tax=Mycena pura TaxID=153505 RepID=A0AAD6V6C2_9AGAR|nr:hypothetical protein GGX14DRAFT_659051 [Mycena pura]